MIIPDTIISEIQNAVNIVDVISESVVLKKTGMNYVGLCPFHSEKTPSFSVSPEKQMFYCFGCGVGGNVFTFLMKHEGLSFADAAQMLSGRSGVVIPDSVYTKDQIHRKTEREIILSVNRQAMAYFQDRLKDASGGAAMKYLAKRGVGQDIISCFRLGFAPDGWDNLTAFLFQQRIPAEHAEKAGLIVSKNKPGYYDRFRNRIMFPIMNAREEVIGFGGRVMDDSLPKYLNSPETSVYNKSRSLYGLNAARQKCREAGCAYLVEGYFDLIAMHMSGFENTVATLGTALTTDHVRVLKGFCDRMIMVYDSDAAGIKAAQRSIDIFRKENADARFMVLPQGDDPDSFLLRYGADAFSQAASGALSAAAFLLECAVRKHGLSTEGKIRIADDMAVSLTSVQDNLSISLYIKEIAEKIGAPESLILDKIRSARSAVQPVVPKKPSDSDNGTEHHPIERHIIAMMLQHPEIIPEIRRRNCMDFFQDNVLKEIGACILTHRDFSENSVSDLINSIQNDDQKRIALSLAIGSQLGDNRDLWKTEGCIMLLDQFEAGRHRPLSELSKRVKTAEENNNPLLRQKTLEDMNLYLRDIRERQLQSREKKFST